MEKFSIGRLLNKYFVVILMIFAAPWTWRIFNYNIYLCLLLIFISYIFLKLFLINQLHTVYIVILCSVFLVVSVINLQLGFDRQYNKLSIDEEVQLNERHTYYAEELGGFFLNKYSLNYYKNYSPYFSKFQRNFFSVLDPNLYFFASHPRERAGIDEFEKFPSAYLFLFIFGILYILQTGRIIVMVGYLLPAVFISGFIAPTFFLGPILFFPFITTLISLGLIYLFDLAKRKMF